ncbi:GlxA family transcriptional regulator [Halomonas alkalicola]|uniref:GlxA family transcriptional regulator n=1 Tax=Halomonas alkalicola TaxID=1930622 RepID=UPI0035EA951D
MHEPSPPPPASSPSRRVGVLVLPGFSLLAQACATEPLTVAGQLAGAPLYRLVTLGAAVQPVASASGQRLLAELSLAQPGLSEPGLAQPGLSEPGLAQPGLSEPGLAQPGLSESGHAEPGLAPAAADLDMLLVCAPGAQAADEALRRRLVELAIPGRLIAGIGGGAELLARAGLLDGYRATVPWQHLEAVRRAHPRIRLSRQPFEIDRERLTCGGGTAALDMMMTLIGRQHGSQLAERVSAHFVLERVRMGEEPSGPPSGGVPESLAEALALMEANVEEPLTTAELAEHLGISRRQLERLFKKHLQAVPSRYYLDLRLQRARRLLRESEHPAGEVAMLTGFSSAAHFSTAYRNHFGLTPREERLG